MSCLVSVVMPSLNQCTFIQAAIESVLAQDYPHIELIVADGGSRDGTVTVLRRLQVADQRLVWFSEKDGGPANAVNRALGRVRGTIIGWLNADDLYAPGAVRSAVGALRAEPSWLMVYGHGRHIDAEGNVLGSYPTLPPSTPAESFNAGCFICQPTVFFRRTMYLLLGSLDEELKTAFDFDYWVRAFLSFCDRIGFVDSVLACSRLHESCITRRSRRTVALEGMAVLARHFGQAPGHWLRTYVEELLSGQVDAGEVGDLRAHAMATLSEATCWLAPMEFQRLEDSFTHDHRLRGCEKASRELRTMGMGQVK